VQARIVSSMIGMVYAIPSTPLHARLKKEGRLDPSDEPAFGTNVIPAQLDRAVLRNGYLQLLTELHEPNAFLIGWIRFTSTGRCRAIMAGRLSLRRYHGRGIITAGKWHGEWLARQTKSSIPSDRDLPANKNGAPREGSAVRLSTEIGLGLGGLFLLDRRLLVGGHDFDLTGLQRLGDAADELDMEQAVHKPGRLDFDMLGKLEPALESAAGDAAMQELRAFGIGLGLAFHGQRIVLDSDIDVTLTETGNRDGNAVGVLAELFDIVGGVGDRFGGLRGLDQTAEPVEAD